MKIISGMISGLARVAALLLPNCAYWLLKYVWRSRRAPRFGRATGFSEKIHYKLAFDRRGILVEWSDKLRAREYARKAAAEAALPAIYWQAEDARGLPFDALPDEFVLKASHGSGWSRIVFNKHAAGREALVQIAREWLRQSYFLKSREWAYRGTVPRVYAEQILRTRDGRVAGDWNLYVCHGKVRLLQALTDLPDGMTLGSTYGRDGRRLDVEIAYAQGPDFPRPANFEKMIRIAEMLSRGIDFVRVDLYLVGDRVFFGEMTSYPHGGAIQIVPPGFDEILGRWFRPDWEDYAIASGITEAGLRSWRWPL